MVVQERISSSLKRRKNTGEVSITAPANQGVTNGKRWFGDEKEDVETCEGAQQNSDQENLRTACGNKQPQLLIFWMIKKRKEKFGAVQRVDGDDIEEHEKKVEEDEQEQED